MTDILIRGISDEAIARIEEQASKLGLSRNEYLRRQLDTVARFDYESHRAALSGPAPHWPQSTRSVSELRLSLRLRPRGPLSALRGERRVHLDIIDYPGEWLLDLTLLDRSYRTWADGVLARNAGQQVELKP